MVSIIFIFDIENVNVLALSDIVEFDCFLCVLMFASSVMNHAAASGSTFSPEVPVSSGVMSNSWQPASGENVQMADRSTIYKSHDYEELPTSRFLSQVCCLMRHLLVQCRHIF